MGIQWKEGQGQCTKLKTETCWIWIPKESVEICIYWLETIRNVIRRANLVNKRNWWFLRKLTNKFEKVQLNRDALKARQRPSLAAWVPFRKAKLCTMAIDQSNEYYLTKTRPFWWFSPFKVVLCVCFVMVIFPNNLRVCEFSCYCIFFFFSWI